jgi:hypothetical protein
MSLNYLEEKIMRISSRLQVIVYIFALVFGVRHANPAGRVQINNV